MPLEHAETEQNVVVEIFYSAVLSAFMITKLGIRYYDYSVDCKFSSSLWSDAVFHLRRIPDCVVSLLDYVHELF